MARQQLSVEERRRRNREYQKKRREKIYSKPELKEEYLRKEKQRWKKRVEDGKIKTISDLNEREKRSKRKAWKRRQQESRERKRKLMEEMEQEPQSGPDRTTTDMSAGVINCGDWLAVIYDQNWWLAKAVTVDAHHQDVQVEFFHPHGPNMRFHPKPGGKDMCFVPVEDILVKLMEPSSPGCGSRTREIYHLSAEVMDFIEKEHINRLLLDKAD
ncbi:uncharacterized protein [Mobula birostris]|uniref:uncharacterized protein n=1 Tax=Mobula birostris TaxID=1983395 RepID=UPI003B27D4DB